MAIKDKGNLGDVAMEVFYKFIVVKITQLYRFTKT